MTYDIYLINPQCIVYGYSQKLEYKMTRFYTTIASDMRCNNLSSQPIQLKALGCTKSYSNKPTRGPPVYTTKSSNNMRSTSNTTKSSSSHNLYHSASKVVGNKLGHPSYFVINGQGAESSSNMSIVHQV